MVERGRCDLKVRNTENYIVHPQISKNIKDVKLTQRCREREVLEKSREIDVVIKLQTNEISDYKNLFANSMSLCEHCAFALGKRHKVQKGN
jgi:hypothetical protein